MHIFHASYAEDRPIGAGRQARAEIGLGTRHHLRRRGDANLIRRFNDYGENAVRRSPEDAYIIATIWAAGRAP
jgi:hypothetical protein